MKFTRRRFLKWGATGLVAVSGVPAACAPSIPQQQDEQIDSVIVIGGGLSGLVSAHLLSQAGKRVTVLEANEHAGGRVHTERWPNGQISELGFEEFFDQEVYPDIWWLVDELGLQDEVIPYRGSIGAFLRDQYVPPSRFSQWLHDLPWQAESDPDNFTAMAEHVSDSIGLWNMPDDEDRYATFDSESMQEWILRSFDLSGSGDIDWLTSIFLKPEVGVPSDQTSAAYGILNLWIWYNASLYHLRQGNEQFITRLLDRLPQGSLTLNAKVSAVRNLAEQGGVEVEYTDQSGSQTVRADVAIVAVPHPVVSQIVSDLPADRQQTLASLAFSRVIRHNAQYSERVWETQHGFSGSGVYTDQTATWITNTPAAGFDTGVLAAYIDEPAASDLWRGALDNFMPHHLLDEAAGRAITQRVLQEMMQFWPGLDSVLLEARTWQVPYYGPVYPPHYVLDGHYALNRQPVGRIHFAGDWVYGFGANDAVRRGRDVAHTLTTISKPSTL